MRTTMNIDDDVLEQAKALAAQHNTPLGKVISDLARRSLARPKRPGTQRNGIPLLPTRRDGKVITLETVNALRDEQP
ncbi:MAG: CopG family transcriptional regulator [Parvibaculum sp.]|nr:CopG family transcriptional regulator [Parvibaculum sp.]